MEDISGTHQWCVGDKCMAPYSGDALYYRASVQTVARSSQGHYVATVRFSGFTEEEDEIIDVRQLKQRPTRDKASIPADSSGTSKSGIAVTTAPSDVTSPLKYVSEEERLRTKYADLFDDSGSSSGVGRDNPKRSSPSSSTSSPSVTRGAKKRKTPVAIGGEVKDDNVTHPKRSPASTASHAPPRVPVRQASEKDSFSFLDEGFSCEEMEKPFFPGVSNASAKVPLVLSQAGSDSLIQVPATINRYLRDYQREGVKFLYQRYQRGEGAILGDDMGLGKTIQVLAFLCAVLRKTGTKEDCQRRLPEFLQKKVKPSISQSSDVFLIICPTSVLFNWLDEFETWTYCTVGKYHGRERQETLWKAMKGKLDAVITSYETYRIYMESLLKVKWAGVIVDEVHKIKESGSQITQALKEVNTRCRYGLTGTALQNKLSELWCVLDWANPDCLGSLVEFKAKFEDAMSRGQKFHASKRELAESRRVSEDFAAMRDRWMIRRTKSLISHQLPTKDEKVVFCKLTPLQLSIYRTLLESDDMKLVLQQKDICDCGSQKIRMQCCYKYNAEGEKIKALTMGFMSLLIKVANHVALLTPNVRMSDKQRAKARKYCDIAFAHHPQFVALSREARFCTLSDPSYCGKMQILEKLLEVFKKEGSKVLLFSYYTQLLNIIEMYLKTTYYVYRRLDGKTPVQDRQKYVHEFNTDRDIFLFLISTKAGGLGLNLTGANVVIIFDPNWNPTYDLQAQDRAYRIGQHRDVRVYRLISIGSIEENMYLRQVYKQQLASAAVTSENPMRYFTAVAGDKKQQGELFGLHNMFALRADTSCLTKDLIQRHLKTEEGITMAKYTPPSPSAVDTNQSCSEDKTTEVEDDSDSDSSHSNTDLPSQEEGLGDDHGVASQLLSDSDSDADGNDDAGENPPAAKQSAVKRGNRQSTSPSVKTAAQSLVHQENAAIRAGATRSRPNQEQNVSESSSDEDLERDETSRGKAIQHRGGRVERRTKGRGAATDRPNEVIPKCGAGSESTKRSKVAVIKPEGRRTVGDNKDRRKDESKQSAKAVDDIFKECGVAFVHSNLRIVGGSRVEDHVSNIAMRDVYDLGMNSQQPANYNVPTLPESAPDSLVLDKQSSQSDGSLHELLLAQSQPASHRMNGTTVLFGQTPRGIRRNQFEAMAKALKHNSNSDFARYVLSLSEEQYTKLLRDYYMTKYPQLDLEKLYQPPAPPDEQFRDVQIQRGQGRRSKRVDGKNASRKQNVKSSAKRGAPKGCQFESQSEDDRTASDGRLKDRTQKEKISKNKALEPGPGSDASTSDAEDEASKLLTRLGASKVSKSSEEVRRRTKRNKKDDGKRTTREATEGEEESNYSDSTDDGLVPSRSEARKVSRPLPNQRGRRTKPDQRQRDLKVSPTTRALINKKSSQKVSRHVTYSDDEWLKEESNHAKKTTQPSPSCQTQDRNASDSEERPLGSPSGRRKSTPGAEPLHEEGNLTFLDDIFLPEHSKRPAKPPPKKKSQRVRQKATICLVKGDFSDSDVEMEDLSDAQSCSVLSIRAENIRDAGEDASPLWRRNSKFATRQSVLEQASLEAKLDRRSVFEKYAESFVPNEHFVKRGLDRGKVDVEETVSTQDGSINTDTQPTTSVIANSSSF